MEKTKQFLMVNYEILKINTITHNGKKFKFTDTLKNTYCYILGWGKAFPSYNKIADVFGITKGSAQDRINKLVEMGLVEKLGREKGKQRLSNLYHALPINNESTTGRSYSENIGTRHQQPTQVKGEVTAPSKAHIEELETLETESVVESKMKHSFADELDNVDYLPQKEVAPVEKKIYPWSSSKVYQSNGRIDQLAWDWALRESNQNESSALALMIKTTSFNLKRDDIPGFSISEDEYILPF